MNANPLHADQQQQIAGFIKKNQPFANLSPKELDSIAKTITYELVEAKVVLIEVGSHQPQNLYLLLSGEIDINNAGTGKTTHAPTEINMFGHFSLISQQPFPYSATTLSQCRLGVLSKKAFDQVCHAHPRVAAYFESDVRGYLRQRLALYDLAGTQFLFGTRLSDLVQHPAVTIESTATVQQAAQRMQAHHSDNLVVLRNGQASGLITDRLFRKLTSTGTALSTPIHLVMETDLHHLSARHSLFEALLLMLQYDAKNILVHEHHCERIVGVISHVDIARAHGYSPALLFQQLDDAPSIEYLAELRREANLQILALYHRGVRTEDLITINTVINDNILKRVLSLNHDQPPIAAGFKWSWLALGSEGRGEMALKTDQDNALIYQVDHFLDKAASSQFNHQLADWTHQINQQLDQTGLSLCTGNMMASNSNWRHTAAGWEYCLRSWLSNPKPAEIMQIAATCDMRAVHGDTNLGQTLKTSFTKLLSENPRFPQHMARGALTIKPALKHFPVRLATTSSDKDRVIDIKRHGVQPLVDFARIMALQIGYLSSSNTFDRLNFLQDALPKLEAPLRDAREAYRYLNDLRFGHHLQAIQAGNIPDNQLAVNKLSETQRDMLKASLLAVEGVQSTLTRHFSL